MNWWIVKRRRSIHGQTLGDNLVANPSVEFGDTDPDSWFYSLTGTEWVDGQGHSGSKAVRLNVAADTADWRSAVYDIEGGLTYRCGMWVKGVADIVTVLAVRWFSDEAGEDYISETWIVLQGTNADWTRYYQDIAAPSNALSGDLMFRAAFATTINVLGDDFFVQSTSLSLWSLIFDKRKNSMYIPIMQGI